MPLLKSRRAVAGLFLVAAIACLRGAEPGVAARFSREQLEFYEKQVQPILSENCFKCHSHQAEKIKGNLVLDSREGALKGGESGPAIVAGEPERSLLVRAVRQVDEELQMPPKKKLQEKQIALLIEWIKIGAPYPEPPNGALAAIKGRRATSQDRNWWAFQPLRTVKVPEVKDDPWSRNPIDKFILTKLKAEQLVPAPQATKRTLIRRVYLDLVGLPPTAEEVESFLADASPGAYETLVERLLQQPQYGEKWARHWLDLTRYAESDGYKSDSFRPNAWRYRDYVIRSFNEDKPYNRFLMEQIAADELWPDDPEALVGVSFLRLPIYEYNQRNVKGQWATILNDITDVSADAFLALGLQCARCHDHKFDPILQRDYYRMQAFFGPLSLRDDLPLATKVAVHEYRSQLAAWQAKTAAIHEELESLEKPARQKITEEVIRKFPKEIQAIMSKPASERTPYEQQINDLAYRQVTDEMEKIDGRFKGAEKERRDALLEQLSKYDSNKPKPLPEAMLISDVGKVAPLTTVPKDKSQKGIEPGLLTLLEEAAMKIESVPSAPDSTGRRAALARWLAQPDNQFTTRAIVNRIWQRHFGRGLVATLNDFGHLGEEPSHPELLDWLARYLVEHNWSLKQVHRLIVTSAAYCQNASVETRSVDPDNRLLWRQNLRRLDSEQIRDAMLHASGELDLQAGGSSVDPSKPRRTIYTKWLRNSRDSLLGAFDPPDAYTSTPQRNETTTPMQSLVMLNGPYVLQRAEALARRIEQTKPDSSDPKGQIRAAYRFVLCREPKTDELSAGTGFLRDQAERIAHAGAMARADIAPMPKRSGSAAAFNPGSRQTRLQVPDNHLMPQYDFTIEAFILLRSVDTGAEPRTIVSRWDGRKDQPGWSLGISGSDSGQPARTLLLELIGDPSEDGSGGYESISSGLRIELDMPYYVSVAVRIGDLSESGVTFYARKLTEGALLETAHVVHRVNANHQSNLPLTIGGRDAEKRQIWDGLIDDVRLSRRALKADELLLAHEGVDDSTVGYWRFEEPDLFKDSSPHGHNIRAEISPAAQSEPRTAALIDFCHVLLNSSEFLYAE